MEQLGGAVGDLGESVGGLGEEASSAQAALNVLEATRRPRFSIHAPPVEEHARVAELNFGRLKWPSIPVEGFAAVPAHVFARFLGHGDESRAPRSTRVDALDEVDVVQMLGALGPLVVAIAQKEVRHEGRMPGRSVKTQEGELSSGVMRRLLASETLSKRDSAVRSMPEINTSIEAFEAYIGNVRSPATASKYASAVRVFMRSLDDDQISALEDLPPNALSHWVQKLAVREYAPQTVHLYVHSANRYLRWVRDQGVAVPALLQPDLPRVHTKLGTVLPAEFLDRYMELAGDVLDEPACTAVRLMPCVGLRGSEMCALTLDSLTRRKTRMRDGSVRDTFVFQLKGKGGDERIVPVLEEGRIVLTEYLSGWRKYRKGPWLFPINLPGKRHIADRTLRHGLSKLCDPLGMDFTPHTLRRTYLVRLWRRGVDATVIARIAGHRNIQTTYKHYLSLDEDDILKNVLGEHRGV